jgi:hypothetical protein
MGWSARIGKDARARQHRNLAQVHCRIMHGSRHLGTLVRRLDLGSIGLPRTRARPATASHSAVRAFWSTGRELLLEHAIDLI